ncbi:MAG TPA: YceD family protein [Azospira sp.]|nr:YceD family protein [Azospira sp.]
MSQQVVIDSLAFARDAGLIEGELPVADMPRAHDMLAEVGGSVRYRLQGRVSAKGEPQLLLQLDGFLPLRCQRCLERMDYPFHTESILELVRGGRELSQDDLEDDTRDFLPVQKETDVLALIEDQVILDLPVVPRHESCDLPQGEADDLEKSPFSVLAKLKRQAQ